MKAAAPLVGSNSTAGLVLALDKPEGPTSHDVVAHVRRAFRTRQVGHTGTLDPFATGLLLLCIGPATRLSEYLTGMDKEYEATLRLGFATDTDDLSGTPLGEPAGWRGVDETSIHAAFAAQTGSLLQLPPLFSAKRVAGERAHERARRGEPVERTPVPVRVDDIRVLEIRLPDVRFAVECGSGTYIRSIARDVGAELGAGAHLRQLRRLRVGPHRVDLAVTLDELDSPEAVQRGLMSPADALRHLPRVAVGEDEEARILQGGRIAAPAGLAKGCAEGAPIVLVGSSGALRAVAELRDAALQPRKVFA
ncbi:MAG: tRNA pseudouridine(55) synthase TruB [Gemmatimonadota bacterium]|nr:tRNA pseudouridine(55) synthase TruB [Gemmatimonadota bacterium]